MRFGHAESGTALTQGFADVTKLLRKGGGGDWWLAAPAEPLPRGRKQFAGWTLAVVYEHRDLPRGEAAVYLGPRTGRGDAATVIGLGGAGPVRIGLALWDGDLALTGDELLIDGVPAGEPGNLGGGRNAGAAALACRPVPGLCPWRTPGLDVLRVDGKAPPAASPSCARAAIRWRWDCSRWSPGRRARRARPRRHGRLAG
ncbi:hypothetical protein ACFQZ4_28605 [Catellatospora coxensis]